MGSSEADSDRRLFDDPPARYRILPGFGGHLGEVGIEHLKSLGFGGVLYMQPKEGYLTDPTGWDHLAALVEAFRKNGLYLWLYDEEGFPSGAGGGQVLAGYPEGEAVGLYYDFAFVGPGAHVRLAIPWGDPVCLRAGPVRSGVLDLESMVDLADQLEAARQGAAGGHEKRVVHWDAPQRDRWLLSAFSRRILYERTFAELSDIKTPYHLPNLMDREAVKRFLDLTHERYYERLGKDFGKTIPAFFTDEPCLLNYRAPEPERVTSLPWHADFARWFSERYGYDIMERLPALYHDCGPGTRRIRCDYWQLVSEKVESAYHGQIAQWCEAHGIAYSGHLLMEERLRWHVMMQGDYMRSIRRMHVPGIDVLVSKPEQTRPDDNYYHVALFLGAKYCSSAKHHYRRSRALSETSGYAQWMEKQSCSAEEVRATFSWQCALGIDTFVTFYGGAGFPYGRDFFPPAAWKPINDYVGRLALCLTGGRHVCDVAVFYPIKSQWANHTRMPNELAEEADALQNRLDLEHIETSMELLESQRDFDYIHQEDLLAARISGTHFMVADEAYGALVFPPTDTEDVAVIEKAIEFAEAGGVVLVVGRRALHDAGGNDALMLDSMDRLLAAAPERVRFVAEPGGLASALDVLVPRDFRPEPASRNMLYLHRRKNGHEIFFVVNNAARSWSGSVFLAAGRGAEIWDPVDGSIQPAAVKRVGDMLEVHLTIRPYCGTLIVAGGRTGRG